MLWSWIHGFPILQVLLVPFWTGSAKCLCLVDCILDDPIEVILLFQTVQWVSFIPSIAKVYLLNCLAIRMTLSVSCIVRIFCVPILIVAVLVIWDIKFVASEESRLSLLAFITLLYEDFKYLGRVYTMFIIFSGQRFLSRFSYEMNLIILRLSLLHAGLGLYGNLGSSRRVWCSVWFLHKQFVQSQMIGRWVTTD